MAQYRITSALVGALACAASVSAADTVWHNVQNFPADLETTTDGWSAVRYVDPTDVSYRCAADDFVLKEKTEITTITFWSAFAGSPSIIGGDWYIFMGPAAGAPATLVAAGTNSSMTTVDSGIVNANFGPVMENTIKVTGLTLEPGHYFLAFRTFQEFIPGGKNNNAALTTRWSNATSRAWWNFSVFEDGTVGSDWVPMSQFNLVENQEWAFRIDGNVSSECYPDCDASGALDIDDFICFQTTFALGDPYADCDGSGSLDIDDFICFQTLFAIGC